eukprot:GHVT01096544.1.p1 GENE.GHVT01096544.1~~GHVT01096544.1.p1  ORF type:complete len:302 (+),score=78.01 GHVT01096544.1:1373-2278(+)
MLEFPFHAAAGESPFNNRRPSVFEGSHVDTHERGTQQQHQQDGGAALGGGTFAGAALLELSAKVQTSARHDGPGRNGILVQSETTGAQQQARENDKERDEQTCKEDSVTKDNSIFSEQLGTRPDEIRRQLEEAAAVGSSVGALWVRYDHSQCAIAPSHARAASLCAQQLGGTASEGGSAVADSADRKQTQEAPSDSSDSKSSPPPVEPTTPAQTAAAAPTPSENSPTVNASNSAATPGDSVDAGTAAPAPSKPPSSTAPTSAAPTPATPPKPASATAGSQTNPPHHPAANAAPSVLRLRGR